MSSGLDEDTLRTIQSGRESVGAVLGTAQRHLQKAFIAFSVTLVLSIMVVSRLWEPLKRDLVYSQMDLSTRAASRIVAVTPFDVILLQVKIGLAAGVLVTVPILVYYGRDSLRRRGLWPADRIPRWQLAAFAAVSLTLFSLGVAYAYELFFPIMFSFLAGNAQQAGFVPHYSIVKWVQFVALLAISFGLAAQLPLLMSVLSYTGIVPYETFRDRWRVAVIAIFGVGALFSPPDPFTQIMWATPLVGLYVISLGISKAIVLAKRAGERVSVLSVVRARWNLLAGSGFVVGAAVFYLLTEAFGLVQTLAGAFPSSRLTAEIQPPALFGLGAEPTAALLGGVLGLLAAGGVLYYYTVGELSVAAAEEGNFGDPTDIDIGPLSASAVRQAPPEAFEEMTEEEAVEHAQRAMDDDDAEKAQAVLDRFDQAEEFAAEGDAEADAEGAPEEEGNVVTSTTAGVVDAFTEEETTEDDIGGYYYDIAFILDSLTSKAIWIVAVFMLVTGVTFVFLYAGVPGAGGGGTVVQQGTIGVAAEGLGAANGTTLAENGTVLSEDGRIVGQFSRVVAGTDLPGNATRIAVDGSVYDRNDTLISGNVTAYAVGGTVVERSTSGIGLIKNTFVSQLPPQMKNDVQFVTLHPVEHLIFIVKFSTVLGIVTALPLIIYFAWPALRERGVTTGDRTVLAGWGGTVVLSLVGGVLLGFLYIAPTVISWLAFDVLQAEMVIAYRVAKFGWLVLMLTVGIGLLVEIPVSMLLFHKGGVVSFETIRDRWRPIVLGIFAAGALLSPQGIFTMFLIAIPAAGMFMLGLGLLWLYTLGGRRTPGSEREPAD
jgi:sec-independent protein translocase protein TatC